MFDTTVYDRVASQNFDEITRLFTDYGKASDSLIEFKSSTSDTKVADYMITITQLATQSKVEGSAAANLTITNGVNDVLELQIGSQTASITLSAGTYTAAQLAEEVQSKINGASSFVNNGYTVNVTQSAGVMTITMNQYGSETSLSVTGGTGATDLLGGSPTTTAGLDVAGTFNGIAGEGFGQDLIAKETLRDLKYPS